MEQLLEQCSVLNKMIMDSKEYKNYVFARNNMLANEDLNNALTEFKNRYADVMKYTEGNPYDELLNLYYENDELIHNSIVNEYLRAESAFSKLIKKVLGEITDGFSQELML